MTPHILFRKVDMGNIGLEEGEYDENEKEYRICGVGYLSSHRN